MRIIRLEHDTVNFTYTTDYHLTEVPPGLRTAGYRDEILAKLEFTRDLTHKINGVGLCGGDIFHSKNPRAPGNSFSLLVRLEDVFRQFPLGGMFGVHGNHDLNTRPESIPHQPIGALIASGALTDISTESIIFENHDGSVRVQVDAYPYTDDDMEALDRVLNAPPREQGVQYRIVLMHQYGNPGDQGSMFGHPTIGFNQMADCDYDVALWGHDHSRCEPMQVGNCTHIRLGSLARAAYQSDEVDRPVAVAVLSFGQDRVRFKEVPVPVKPLELAFVAAHKQVEKVRQSEEVVEFFQEMDAAVGNIESTDPREVMLELADGDKKLFDLAADLCGL